MQVEATHLQMIQAVISRLSSQSTTVKGWCVTLTAATLGFGATTTRFVIVLIAIYVVMAFAVLDAYFLSLERAYRQLYADVVSGSAGPWVLEVERPGWRKVGHALRSPSVGLTYGGSLLTALGVAAYLLAL